VVIYHDIKVQISSPLHLPLKNFKISHIELHLLRERLGPNIRVAVNNA